MEIDMIADAAEAPMAEETDAFDWTEEAATFGDRLALARRYQAMDQSQLARRLGVKLDTIRNWENDRSEPRANRLQMLAGLLNVSIVWLMTGDGDGGPEALSTEQTETSTDLRALLLELRELRLAQTRLVERTGRIERQVRNLIEPA